MVHHIRSSSPRCRRPALTAVGVACLASALVVTQAGCLGMVSNLMNATGANMVQPEFDGLEGKRLAIVTVTEMGQYSNDPSAKYLSAKVGEILRSEIDEMRVVREDKIFEWIDQNGFDSTDFYAIGEGVKADYVLGIEIVNMRLREGQTLYRGQSDVSFKLIDVATGEVEVSRDLEDFTFPTTAGQYTSETTETKFRRLYLKMMGEQIARSFHPYDPSVTVALDGLIASQ